MWARLTDTSAPEYSLIQNSFAKQPHLLRLYSIYHYHDTVTFEKLRAGVQAPKSKKKGAVSKPKSVTVFYGGPEQVLRRILQFGFYTAFVKQSRTKGSQMDDIPFIFHTSPLEAAKLWQPLDGTDGSARYRAVLSCELLLANSHTHFGSGLGLQHSSDETADSVAHPLKQIVSQLQPSSISGQVPYGDDSPGFFYFVRRSDEGAKLAIAHFYALCEISDEASPSVEEMLTLTIPPAVHVSDSPYCLH